jgi:hypothetical protein
MNNRLDSFDILARANSELSALASNAGIDWQALSGLINRNQTIYKRGIALDKKAKEGSPSAKVIFNETNGQEWPFITFKTFKHGGITEKFNGWQWLKDNGYLSTHSEPPARPSVTPPKAEPAKLKPVQTIAARACVACKTDFIPPFENSTHCEYCYKLSRFNETQKHFNRLKPIEETSSLTFEYRGVLGVCGVLIKSYLAKKGFSIDDVKASGLDVRRGRDIRGAFIIVQATNGEKITGYQKIYDAKFVGYNGELRDKDFIFYPKKDSVTNDVKTYKTGSYLVLGSLDNADKGLYFAEGLATGLSVFKATGKTTIVCFDAGNLSAVMAKFRDYSKKYIAADNDYKAVNNCKAWVFTHKYEPIKLSKTAKLKPVKICPSCGKHIAPAKADTGNTGIYSALKAAKRHKARVFVPILKDSAGNFLKADFNDLHQASGLDAVSYQLKLRKNPNEIEPTRETLFKYCPQEQIKKEALSVCLESVAGIVTLSQLKTESKAIQAMFDNRGFTEFKARPFMRKALRKQLDKIRHENFFTGHPLVKRIDVKGLTNEQIAGKVANLSGVVIDNRSMAAGKTELMRLISDIKKQHNKPVTKPKRGHDLTDTDRKAYFLSDGVMNANDWQKLTAKPADFAIWKKYNDDKARAWLKTEPELNPIAEIITAITHRTSLVDSHSERLGLLHYDRVKSFNPESLAVCLPSITKFEGLKPTVLFLDEWRQELEFLHNSGGCIDNPLAVEKQLIEWLNGSNLTVLADADMNSVSVEWVLKHCPSLPVYWLDDGKRGLNGKELIINRGHLETNNDLIVQAIDAAKKGGRVWLAFDGIDQARKACQNFIKAGIEPEKILLVHAENKGDIRQALFLDKPNQESANYQVIIHTPVISSGVSIWQPFDFVGAGFCGVLTPNQMLQTIARVRLAKKIHVGLMLSNNETRITDNQALIDGETAKRGRYCKESGQLQLTSFDQFRINQIATSNAALNDYENYFLRLVQMKGYQIAEQGMIEEKPVVSTKEVKQFVASDIAAALPLNENEFKELDKKTALTQSESNAVNRYQTKLMAGKSDHEITANDAYFFKYENGLSKVQNAELVNVENIESLKKDDRLNHETRAKLSSKTSKEFLLSYIVNALRDKPVKSALIQFCLDFLHENHKEAAINGLGNYQYKTANIRKLQGFLDKAGYELVESYRESTGGRERVYLLKLNEQIAGYLENRRKAKELLSEFEHVPVSDFA